MTVCSICETSSGEIVMSAFATRPSTYEKPAMNLRSSAGSSWSWATMRRSAAVSVSSTPFTVSGSMVGVSLLGPLKSWPRTTVAIPLLAAPSQTPSWHSAAASRSLPSARLHSPNDGTARAPYRQRPHPGGSVTDTAQPRVARSGHVRDAPLPDARDLRAVLPAARLHRLPDVLQRAAAAGHLR